MLLNDNKKKIATVIVAKLTKKGDNPDSHDFQERPTENKGGPDFEEHNVKPTENDDGHAFESAADEILTAIEHKDVAGLAEALMAFHAIHDAHEEESASSDSESEGDCGPSCNK